MRQPIAPLLFISIIFILSLSVLPQSASAQEESIYEKDPSPRTRPAAAQAKKIIEARARDVLVTIKNKEMQRLATFVHPQRGVRFSTYSWVDRDDKWLSKRQVAALAKVDRRSVWFEADEAGTRMRMTAREYFEKWLYDRDYLKAREVTYNTQHKRSNTIPNVLGFYPRAIVVEYYDPATDPETEQRWDTLWLVFEKLGKEWYLVGVVKDSPTI